ncbi:glycosyltransferase family 15 protein [Pterulicium gracile]|uniref:Glycosyltransferase family 15 protein n=1 Tax=Pterulicium gracile TaxID=1884261 RepID=A0A5C3QT61_9AGAR|nr:glycosyltransferase family 15 protein [Pterula gracilis]
MNTIARYVILVVAILISLHFILTLTHDGYSATVGGPFSRPHFPASNNGPTYTNPPHVVNTTSPPLAHTGLPIDPALRMNATFVVLARNGDLDGIIKSIGDMEDRFNKKFGYPYTFLNDEPFSDEFKNRVSNIISSDVEFGLIPKEHWVQPDWIDEDKATKGREQMKADKVIYGGSVSYRNMCRFNSGFFFRHDLLQKYKWYWRIEPDVHFHCDLDYDPFKFMQDEGKVYGFTITMYEFIKTIPTLWGHVTDFIKQNPHHLAKNNAMGYMSDDGGKTYNKCHFWSNFEIADMDFWRSDAYMEFFNYLDEKGGFYYERWGDAPVHSIGAALFLQKDQIHFFEDIGYEHNPYVHCPQGELWKKGRCACNKAKSFDYDGYSCKRQWDRIQ